MPKQLNVSINFITGIVVISILSENLRQDLRLEWSRTTDGDYGFNTNFHDTLIRLTDVSAQLFVSSLVEMLYQVLGMVDRDNVIITNERGEQLSEIQFIPPTFTGDMDDIRLLVKHQESLMYLCGLFEDNNRRLSLDLLDAFSSEGIIEDFLALLESRISGIKLNLDCLQNNKE